MTNPNLTENEFTADLGLDRAGRHSNAWRLEYDTKRSVAFFIQFMEGRDKKKEGRSPPFCP
jgi:hypothetical protein